MVLVEYKYNYDTHILDTDSLDQCNPIKHCIFPYIPIESLDYVHDKGNVKLVYKPRHLR